MSAYLPFVWPAVASLCAALWFCELGVHVVARGHSVQVLVGSQASLLGVLAGLLVMRLIGADEHHQDWIPLCLGLAVSAGVLRAVSRAQDVSLVALFCGLMALAQLLTKLAPGLESHHAHAFFGDLSSMGDWDAKVLVCVAVLGFGLLVYQRREVTRLTFEVASYGHTRPRGQGLYLPMLLAAIAIGVQYLGVLFTAALFLIPTVVVGSTANPQSQRRHRRLAIAAAALGTSSGYVLSLLFSALPTAPTVVLAVTVTAATLAAAASRLRS